MLTTGPILREIIPLKMNEGSESLSDTEFTKDRS